MSHRGPLDPTWGPDPVGRHEQRYWDGTDWTEHVNDQGVAGSDPIDPPASSIQMRTPVRSGGRPRGFWLIAVPAVLMAATFGVLNLLENDTGVRSGTHSGDTASDLASGDSKDYELGPGGTAESFCAELEREGITSGDVLDFEGERDRFVVLGSAAPAELQTHFVQLLDFFARYADKQYVTAADLLRVAEPTEVVIDDLCDFDLYSLEHPNMYDEHMQHITALLVPTEAKLSDLLGQGLVGPRLGNGPSGSFDIGFGQVTISDQLYVDAPLLAVEACEATSEYVYSLGYEQSNIFVVSRVGSAETDEKLVAHRYGVDGHCDKE